jgi:hypothetical protein
MMRPTINEESDCLRKKNLLRRRWYTYIARFCPCLGCFDARLDQVFVVQGAPYFLHKGLYGVFGDIVCSGFWICTVTRDGY